MAKEILVQGYEDPIPNSTETETVSVVKAQRKTGGNWYIRLHRGMQSYIWTGMLSAFDPLTTSLKPTEETRWRAE